MQEQLCNLDPQRRDPMSCEINQQNLPPEITFKTCVSLFEDALKDPVLKNYLQVLEVIQLALPIYFQYI